MQRRATLSIIGWGLGESCALYGGVVLLLTGSPFLYLTGLLVFLVPFLLFAPSGDEPSAR